MPIFEARSLGHQQCPADMAEKGFTYVSVGRG
jgi:hypothetical protein